MSPRKSMRPEDRRGFNPDTFPMFCRRVREARMARGLTLDEFGALLGMSKQQVSDMEGGQFPRQHDRIIAIADALDVSLDWLFGRTPLP